CSTLSSRIAELYKNIDMLKHNGSDPQVLKGALDKIQASLKELSALEEGIFQENKELALARESTEAERLHYKDLFDLAPHVYLVTDAKGIIKEANHAATDLLKADIGSLTGRSLQSFISSNHLGTFTSHLSRLKCCRGSLRFEAVMNSKDDDLFMASLTVRAVTNCHGCVSGLLWQVQDLARGKQAGAKGEDLELMQDHDANGALLREVVEQMQAGFVVAEAPSGKIIFSNDQAERMLCGEAPSRRLLSLNIFQAFREDVSPYNWPLAKSLLMGEIVMNEEVELARLDGTRFVASISSGPIRDCQGNITAAVATFIDKAKMKKAEGELRQAYDQLETGAQERAAELKRANEELERLNDELRAEVLEKEVAEIELLNARDKAEAAARSKSEFLASMSHEIRTPLNAIIGMAGLLLDEAMPSEKKDYVETIRSSSDVLLSVINDILDISKIEGEKMELERQPFDLRECMEMAIDLVAAEAARKGLNLAYTICQNTPECFTGDPARIRQVLVNLLGNGVKFTSSGEVTISAWHQDRRLYFSVQDTGIGIPQDRMDQLFKSFSQLDASTNRKYGGTGLGLAISKRLVEMMGGEIWAKSVPGGGSTFSFSVLAEAYSCEPKPYLSTDQPMLAGKKVLIAENSRINRIILGHHIQSWGMMPLNASTGREALRMIGRNKFDMAIVDRQVQDIDGLDLAGEIHRQDKSLPIILLTSLGDGDLMRDESPASEILVKPIKPSQLYEAARRIFKGPGEHDVACAKRCASSESHIRVMLAEDNPVNQKVTLKMLERLGYRADVASNGLEVLEAMERQHYDIILMDIQMPEMDGLEAARAIRQRFPPEAQPKIIAITAYALAGDKERCLEAGMDGYISKPVKIEDLKELLARTSS
ncbi:MAG TPA: response regulator, partial [Methanotrichaceae archaeon]|nr:response regulator [Methanotrichaceae archaeon]